jgi:hypothetical protein
MKAFSTVGSAKKILTNCAAFLVCPVRVVITLNFLRFAHADVIVAPVIKAGGLSAREKTAVMTFLQNISIFKT